MKTHKHKRKPRVSRKAAEKEFDPDERGGMSKVLAAQIGNQAVGKLLRSDDWRQSEGRGGRLDWDLARAIQRRRGSGSNLPDYVRREAEAVFGADFSNVRVHTDERADALAQRLQATAFTVDGDVFFRREAYNLSGRKGRELLGHELTHTIQQDKSIGRPINVSNPNDAAEREAEHSGRAYSSTQNLSSRASISNDTLLTTRVASVQRETKSTSERTEPQTRQPVPAPTTFAGAELAEKTDVLSSQFIPLVQHGINAGYYFLMPYGSPGDPPIVAYYVAMHSSPFRNVWRVGPDSDSVRYFIRNADAYELVQLMVDWARTTNNEAHLEQLSATHDVAESGKSLTDRLLEISRARRGRKPSRGGSAVSLVADLALDVAGGVLEIQKGRDRERQHEAMVRLIEGARELGVETLIEVSHELQYDHRGGQRWVVKKRPVFIDVEDVDGRVAARQDLIDHCEWRLRMLDDRVHSSKKEGYESIRDQLKEEIDLLKTVGHESVGPGGLINIYWLLSITSTAEEVIESLEDDL